MQVRINKEARNDFKNLDPSLQHAFQEEKKSLKAWPATSGVKHLTDRWKGFCRTKLLENWRIIFRIIPSEAHPDHITVVRIRHRSVVYK